MEVRMKKVLLAGAAALAIAGSTVAYAQQHRPWFHDNARLSADDGAALTDARIAAVKAGLKLTPDQGKLGPPADAPARDLANLQTARANARMNAERESQLAQ